VAQASTRNGVTWTRSRPRRSRCGWEAASVTFSPRQSSATATQHPTRSGLLAYGNTKRTSVSNLGRRRLERAHESYGVVGRSGGPHAPRQRGEACGEEYCGRSVATKKMLVFR
jgi:hypothetical protein